MIETKAMTSTTPSSATEAEELLNYLGTDSLVEYVTEDGTRWVMQDHALNAFRRSRASSQPQLHERNRWNIEEDGSDLLICFGDHHKGEKCDYVRYSQPQPTAELRNAIIEECAKICDFHGFDGTDEAITADYIAKKIRALASTPSPQPGEVVFDRSLMLACKAALQDFLRSGIFTEDGPAAQMANALVMRIDAAMPRVRSSRQDVQAHEITRWRKCWTDEMRGKCALRCGEFGEPPCWEIAAWATPCLDCSPSQKATDVNAGLLAALKSAVKIADEAGIEWDRAPSSMKAGKILIALAGNLKGYRADIDAIHEAIAAAESASGKEKS